MTDHEVNRKAVGMEVNINEINDIGGFPDNADPSKWQFAVDCSNPNNLINW